MKFPFDIFQGRVADPEPLDEVPWHTASVPPLSTIEPAAPEETTIFTMDALREMQKKIELPEKYPLHEQFHNIKQELFKKDFNNKIYNNDIIHQQIKNSYNSYVPPMVLPPLDIDDYMPVTARILTTEQRAKLVGDLSDLAGI